MDSLTGKSNGWHDHPAAKLWKGHEWWLASYGAAMCAEWIARGFIDNMLGDFQSAMRLLPQGPEPEFSDVLRASMRANLVRKDPRRYRDFLGFAEAPQEDYAWGG